MASTKHLYYYTNKKSRACIVTVVATLMLMLCTETAAQETAAECVAQLKAMATCLPYAQAKAKMPTPDCCSGVIQTLKYNKKCLCMVLKDINDPSLAIKVNLNISLTLPEVCKAPDNVFQCPELLHMDPKSPEAQVFNQLGGRNSKNVSTNSPESSGMEFNCSDRSGNRTVPTSSGEPSEPVYKSEGGACDLREGLHDLKVLILLIWLSWNAVYV